MGDISLEEKVRPNELIEGPILPALLKFCGPVLVALFLQSLYGAVDLMVVGRFGDAASVSGVGTGSAVMQLVTMVLAGLTTGATVVIGRHIGERRPEAAGRTVGAAVALFAVVAIVLTGLMVAFTRPLVLLMQTPAEAVDKAVEYVRICSWGIVFITAYNVLSGIFRGLGDSKRPMIFVAIACVTNIAGDLFCVGVLHMDAAGAAVATVAAQAVSVVLSLVIISRQELPFHFTRKSICFDRVEIGETLRIGAPIALQDALVHLSFLLLNAIINHLGLLQSAGYGVAERVTGFIFLVPSAVMASASTLVAQNIGANRPDRARQVLFTSMAAGTAAGFFLFCAGFFFGGPLSSIFSKDAGVVEQSAAYLRGFSADCLLTCVLFAFTGYFNGCGRTVYVMIQGITSSFLLRVPASYLLSITKGATLTRIGLAAPLATVYGIVFYLICYRRMRRAEGGE